MLDILTMGAVLVVFVAIGMMMEKFWRSMRRPDPAKDKRRFERRAP